MVASPLWAGGMAMTLVSIAVAHAVTAIRRDGVFRGAAEGVFEPCDRTYMIPYLIAPWAASTATSCA